MKRLLICLAMMSAASTAVAAPFNLDAVSNQGDNPLDADYVHGVLAVPHFGGVPTLVLAKADKVAEGQVRFLTQLRTTSLPTDVGAAVRVEVDRIRSAWREAASDGSKTAELSWSEAQNGKSYEIKLSWQHVDFGTTSFVHALFTATDGFVVEDVEENLLRNDGGTVAAPSDALTNSVAETDRVAFTVPAAAVPAPIALPAPTDTENHAAAPSLADGSKLPPMAPIIIEQKKPRDLRWLYALGGLCIFAAVMLMNRKQKAILERDRQEREAAAKAASDKEAS